MIVFILTALTVLFIFLFRIAGQVVPIVQIKSIIGNYVQSVYYKTSLAIIEIQCGFFCVLLALWFIIMDKRPMGIDMVTLLNGMFGRIWQAYIILILFVPPILVIICLTLKWWMDAFILFGYHCFVNITLFCFAFNFFNKNYYTSAVMSVQSKKTRNLIRKYGHLTTISHSCGIFCTFFEFSPSRPIKRKGNLKFYENKKSPNF